MATSSSVGILLSYGIGAVVVLLPFSALHFVWSKIPLNVPQHLSWVTDIGVSLVSWSADCLKKPSLQAIQCLLKPITPDVTPFYGTILLILSYITRFCLGVVVAQLFKEFFDHVLPKIQQYLKAKSLVSQAAPSDVLRTRGNHFNAEQSCSICLQDIQPDDDTYTHAHSCCRSFHRNCLQPWLQTSSACPLDRVRYTYEPNFMRQNFRDAIDVAFIAIAHSADKGMLETIFSTLPTNVFFWALWILMFWETIGFLNG